MTAAKRRLLTDKHVESLRAAPKGKLVDVYDTKIPELAVRVSDRADDKGRALTATYVLYCRWPSTGKPARRKIGSARRMSLAAARKIARQWLDLVEQGIDPAVLKQEKQAEAAKQKAATLALEQHTFEKVAAEWFGRIGDQRKVREVQRDVRAVFVQPWGHRPVTSITPAEVEALIAAKAATGPAHARNLLGYITRLFAWAARQSRFGLGKSPAADLSAADLVGKKGQGTRTLNDVELRALWRAVGRLRTEETRGRWFAGDYPFGPLFRMLMLTGQRKSEVAEARWREFDLTKKLWTIPAERMKSGAAHVVPLTDEMIAILASLPRFAKTKQKPDCDRLFSTTEGARPVNSFGKVKARIDARMLRTLRALARTRGETPSAVTLPRWTIHDLRRTMRTGLSGLPIADRVCELMIAHAQPGLHQIYDLYKFTEEKRQGFALWSVYLHSLLQHRPPDNVVSLRAARKRVGERTPQWDDTNWPIGMLASGELNVIEADGDYAIPTEENE